MNNQENFAKIKALVQDLKIAMLTTSTKEGCLHSRPMATCDIKADDHAFYFFTKDTSPKAVEIDQNPEVNVSYSDEKKHTYLSVCGQGVVVKDLEKIKEHWHEDLKIWFPNGPTDEQIALIKVTPTSAQYWIYPHKQASKLVEFLFSNEEISQEKTLQDNETLKFDLVGDKKNV